MKTFPILLPAGEDVIAAVVTVPDGQPRGVVIVLAGTGRHNVIGGTMAGLLTARVAAEGLASVRLDYAGVGDSPGLVESWSPAHVGRALDAARTAVRTVGEAVGASRFVAVGTCYGSRVSLHLVDEPTCIGAVCLAPPILDHGSVAAAGKTLGGRRLVSAARSAPVLRTILRPVVRLARARKPSRGVLQALANLQRARIVFLYGSPKHEDHYSRKAHESVDAALGKLSAEERERFELRFLDLGPLTTFDGLDAPEQDAILDTVVPYVRACFAPEPG